MIVVYDLFFSKIKYLFWYKSYALLGNYVRWNPQLQCANTYISNTSWVNKTNDGFPVVQLHSKSDLLLQCRLIVLENNWSYFQYITSLRQTAHVLNMLSFAWFSALLLWLTSVCLPKTSLITSCLPSHPWRRSSPEAGPMSNQSLWGQRSLSRYQSIPL